MENQNNSKEDNNKILSKKKNENYKGNMENKNNSKEEENIILLKKQNEDYKKKINQLEKRINELEKIIEEKDININKQKIKNDELNKKIKELLNLQKNIAEKDKDKIKELEDEIKLFRKFYNFLPEEKLIIINFISVDQQLNCVVIAKKTDVFTKIEADLYNKNEKYKLTENYFLVGGKKINRNFTLKDNKIKNNDVITLCVIDE